MKIFTRSSWIIDIRNSHFY